MLLYSIPKHLFIFSLLIALASAKSKNTKREHSRHANDLPNTKDIWKYVNSLDKILNFCLRNKHEIDINLYFGMFLVHVNLKSIVNEKSNKLPTDLRVKVNGLLKKCQQISKYFDQMVRQETSQASQNYKLIYTLMNQEDHWIERMSKFHTDSWQRPKLSLSQEEHKYSNWNKYAKNIKELSHWVPTPTQSDKCLESIAKNPNLLTRTLVKCQVDEICYISLTQGDDFGYALTHRLLQLLVARLGRGCYFFTPELDSELARRFCGTMHAEAGFIARNNYTLAADLLFEQISLCAFGRRAEFLNATWLAFILELQRRHGDCGSQDLEAKMENSTESYENEVNEEYNRCAAHTTSVMACALSGLINYLLETYF